MRLTFIRLIKRWWTTSIEIESKNCLRSLCIYIKRVNNELNFFFSLPPPSLLWKFYCINFLCFVSALHRARVFGNAKTEYCFGINNKRTNEKPIYRIYKYMTIWQTRNRSKTKRYFCDRYMKQKSRIDK